MSRSRRTAEEEDLFARIKRPNEDEAVVKTPVVGKASLGTHFFDTPPDGGCLIGFRVSTGKFGAG